MIQDQPDPIQSSASLDIFTNDYLHESLRAPLPMSYLRELYRSGVARTPKNNPKGQARPIASLVCTLSFVTFRQAESGAGAR
jgi:hypothetical protein